MLLNLLMQTNPEWCMPWPFLQPVPLADISDEQPSVSISQWHADGWHYLAPLSFMDQGSSVPPWNLLGALLPPAEPTRAAPQILS